MENEEEQKWTSSDSPPIGRERSNSDPGVREPRIIMNGNTTVPSRRVQSVFTSLEAESQQPINTPPPVRKNKFTSSIGKIFRPWRWRRKKKSEKFIETSKTLERKLSVRSRKEELYQKGILTAEDVEKAVDELQDDQKPATKTIPGPVPKVSGILKPSPVPSRAPSQSTAEDELSSETRKSVGSQDVIDQLAKEMAKRKAAEETSAGAVTTAENIERHESVENQNQQKKVPGKPQGWVTKSGEYYRQKYAAANQNKAKSFATDYDSTDDEQPQRQGLFGAPIADEESSSDSEEEMVRGGVVTGLASKVKRKDSLATKLKSRPSLKDLEQRNIIQTKTDQEKQDRKAEVGSKLIRRLSSRPTAQELRERNILKSSTPEEERDQKEETKKALTRKLSRRPTIQELKERKILMFNEYVECIDTVEYDRKADKPWTRLTPEDKAAIRKELNEFKSNEMEVHEDSRQYTRFHRP